jgi:hypothetical protein
VSKSLPRGASAGGAFAQAVMRPARVLNRFGARNPKALQDVSVGWWLELDSASDPAVRCSTPGDSGFRRFCFGRHR